MDWQTAQNWLVFLPIVGLIGWYYMPDALSRFDHTQEQGRRGSLAPTKNRDEPETRAKTKTRPTAHARAAAPTSNENGKKRKEDKKPQVASAPAVQDEEPDEIDMSTKQFAMQMAQARKGHHIGASKEKQDRVKTVKQGSARGALDLSSGSSQAGADADDDMSPAVSPALHAGDVSDMLEPKASGPSTLRLTASNNLQKEKKARQAKEEVVMTKKQRQNRKRVEEQKESRAEEERQRRVMEEQQRRAARISRGEPAKNGIPVSKPPASNAWSAPKASTGDNAPVTNGNHGAPMLDTFDAESTGSSNGGMEASTAATSTTEAGPTRNDHEMLSEEDQMAKAMRQSEDESGWTEVAAPKKSKKKTVDGEQPILPEPVATNKVAAQKANPVTANGVPNGFHALDDHYEQRTGAEADPSDASNWDA